MLFSCSNNGSTTQSQESIETSSIETNIIDLPDWIGDDEVETIKKIEAQDSLDYNDYIQLAISYAELDDSTKVGTNVERALIANTNQACKALIFLIANQRDWKITSNYKEVVNSKLTSFNCK